MRRPLLGAYHRRVLVCLAEHGEAVPFRTFGGHGSGRHVAIAQLRRYELATLTTVRQRGRDIAALSITDHGLAQLAAWRLSWRALVPVLFGPCAAGATNEGKDNR